jgi:hypothetical protein
MVMPLEENANKMEDTNNNQMMDDFHNAATVHTGKNLTSTGAEWKEIHLLLEIIYELRTEARTSLQKHMMILKALENAFDNTELEIYDNKNHKLLVSWNGKYQTLRRVTFQNASSKRPTLCCFQTIHYCWVPIT